MIIHFEAPKSGKETCYIYNLAHEMFKRGKGEMSAEDAFYIAYQQHSGETLTAKERTKIVKLVNKIIEKSNGWARIFCNGKRQGVYRFDFSKIEDVTLKTRVNVSN